MTAFDVARLFGIALIAWGVVWGAVILLTLLFSLVWSGINHNSGVHRSWGAARLHLCFECGVK